MKRLLLFTLAAAATGGVSAQDKLFVYPAAGQSAEQLEQDRYQCYRWAVDNSGVDPNTLAVPNSTPVYHTNENRNNGAKGTLIGAVAGAAIGSSSDRHHGTARGAILGATLGSIIGKGNERKGAEEARQKNRDVAYRTAAQERDYQAQLSAYNRAFSACMEARDYTVR